ncbi:MAG: DUF362 domain-containing protein [Desulfobacterales bacterium]|nr:DUF362 domain-containing protein [Desulfobacteraceae bacterium]MBT4365457.1 DUF362 domain-containing protein [Desulfobacteraceae bacterium]MBT7085618.1 DUF362 domain-containing protein [Desulfobacterales bacterium]MBT7696482.1 DUF362 domain-containing protein [Desulfobacterales bacterium]
MDKHKISRRDFIGYSTGIACTALLPTLTPNLLAAAEKKAADLPVLKGYKPGVSSGWIPKGDHEKSYDLVKKVIEASTDFSWLSKGDSVFIKLALNSGFEFPATTDPWMLDATIKILKEKGAGEIYVGDKSGVENVHWSEIEERGSSRELCKSSTLLKVIKDNEVNPVFFEEDGLDSYIATAPEGSHHWKQPMMIPAIIKKMDHIIYMPRVSSHLLGDITSGFKIGVGFLRDDSRLAFHQGGDNFYAMYEEINHVPEIKSKLRLTITSGRKVLSTFGPDKGFISEPDYGLIFATEDLLANELLSYAWLQWNREFNTSAFSLATIGNITRFRSLLNKFFLGQIWKDDMESETPGLPMYRPGNIYNHPSIVNFLSRKGGRPEKIIWNQINKIPDKPVSSYIKKQIMA